MGAGGRRFKSGQPDTRGPREPRSRGPTHFPVPHPGGSPIRTLASIQRIDSVRPIPGADQIALAAVLGWSVVVKPTEFAAGDRVVYCEVDSLLPERPDFEFLRKSSYRPAVSEVGFERPAGFRIKTVRLRGQVSQGICLPLSVLPPAAPGEVGDDVTAILGITKYEMLPPAGMAGRVKGGLPAWLPKTDETRVQLLGALLETYRGQTFAVTEKLDGTSFSAFLRDGDLGVCSRNLELDPADTASALVRYATHAALEARLQRLRTRFGFDVAIQGEIIGPGIQGNKYALQQPELRVFNLLHVGERRLIDHDAAIEALDSVGIARVPELAPLVLNHTVDELVKLSEGPSVLNPKVHREGVVLRPFVEVADPVLGARLSFKVINPQFLLKYDD